MSSSFDILEKISFSASRKNFKMSSNPKTKLLHIVLQRQLWLRIENIWIDLRALETVYNISVNKYLSNHLLV